MKTMKKIHPKIYESLDSGYGILCAYDEIRNENIEPIDFDVVECDKVFAKIKIINPSGEEEIIDIYVSVLLALEIVETFYRNNGRSFKGYDVCALDKFIDGSAIQFSLAMYPYEELLKYTNDKRLALFHHFYSYNYGWHSPHIYLLLRDEECVLKWASENLNDFSIDFDEEYGVTIEDFIRENVKNPEERIARLKELKIIE